MSDAQTLVEQAQALLLEAALDPGLWPDALNAIADACGARSGQFINLDDQGAIRAHWLTRMPEDVTRDIAAFGLTDPGANPRLRIGLRAPVLQAVADQDHVDRDARARHPIYAELFDRYDVAFNCQAVVLREPGRLVRMSVSRTARQGPLDAQAFRAFAALTPHVQTAARFQAALETAWIDASVRTLDVMATPGFLIDTSGRVAAASEAGERLAMQGEVVAIRGGRLAAARPEDAEALDARIQAALEHARTRRLTTGPALRLRDRLGGPGLAFEIQPLAGPAGLNDGAAVLVAARAAAAAPDRLEHLRAVYGLSQAEAEVAVALADGLSVERIAADRGVSASTVRSQLRAMFAKMDIHRQGELVARVRDLS